MERYFNYFLGKISLLILVKFLSINKEIKTAIAMLIIAMEIVNLATILMKKNFITVYTYH